MTTIFCVLPSERVSLATRVAAAGATPIVDLVTSRGAVPDGAWVRVASTVGGVPGGGPILAAEGPAIAGRPCWRETRAVVPVPEGYVGLVLHGPGRSAQLGSVDVGAVLASVPPGVRVLVHWPHPTGEVLPAVEGVIVPPGHIRFYGSFLADPLDPGRLEAFLQVLGLLLEGASSQRSTEDEPHGGRAHAQFVNLLRRCFSPVEFVPVLRATLLPEEYRDVVDNLPSPDQAPVQDYFERLTAALERRQLVDAGLFQQILSVRGRWSVDICSVARMYGV